MFKQGGLSKILHRTSLVQVKAIHVWLKEKNVQKAMLYWNAKIIQCKYQKQSTRNKMKKKKKVVASVSLSRKKIAPNSENLYDHFNTIDSNNEFSSENSESKQDFSKNSCKNACLEIGNGTSKVRNSENIEGERNTNGNQAVLLENRLKGKLVIKNVANLSKRNLNDVKIS